ncbi:prepilin-type N-terminal cleavage/methylation domain-containing protein [Haloferula luteola]|uniref:Prepilin-type N-terminal cleavage/methylation domain-containing protein n=1 Tax=Haloferula luteola TaxID=595692 RepID=A0A840UZS5_9BACT|nr:prepilin-type N-terminal cleavage/methylation domain-containing protein [Haloferula luteola]MBB5350503.1 prepilin-type N-terminal cleavage/methylation domain-containing protein [Haloferula luteola]
MKKPSSRSRGFTLVELLVVIVIIAVLASLAFVMAKKGISKAQSTSALNQMRNLAVSMEMFEVDYRTPPIPERNRDSGRDVLYGVPGGDNGTEMLFGALLGHDENAEPENPSGDFLAGRDLNYKDNSYIEPKYEEQPRNGVYRKDGKIYDFWGRELMIAVNVPPFEEEDTGGVNDKVLNTDGFAEWNDVKPLYQSYVIWSYGKDGEKADNFSGSDDVKNF